LLHNIANLLEDVLGLKLPLEDTIVALYRQLRVQQMVNSLLVFLLNLSGRYGDSGARFREMRLYQDPHYRDVYSPREYLELIVSRSERELYEDPRMFERRMGVALEHLRARFGSGLHPRLVEEMVSWISELAHEGRYREMSESEFYGRAEAMLLQMVVPNTRPTRKPKTQTRPKES
jgi:hypothetical protein